MQLVPDAAPPRRYFGVSHESGRLGCDALAAAWLAEFYDAERAVADEAAGLTDFLAAPLNEAYPVLRKDLGEACPVGAHAPCPRPKGGRTVEEKIVHLQDEHGFSRERVADWLHEQGL